MTNYSPFPCRQKYILVSHTDGYETLTISEKDYELFVQCMFSRFFTQINRTSYSCQQRIKKVKWMV